MRNNLQLRVWAVGVLAVALGFLVVWWFVAPTPPERIVMAGGPPGGAQEALTREYARLPARQHVRLEVRPSAGSGNNLRLLADRTVGVDAASVGGELPAPAGDRVVSLGARFLEPLWVFTRLGPRPARLNELRGRRLARGQRYSCPCRRAPARERHRPGRCDLPPACR